MNTGFSGHAEFEPQLAAYAAGGLDPAERDALEAHLAQCPRCAAKLAELQELDREIGQLFEDVRPTAGFEDRMVQGFRQGPRRNWIVLHPMVRRVASGVAAVLVLGAVGYGASEMIENNRLPWMSTRPQQVAIDLPSRGDEAGRTALYQEGRTHAGVAAPQSEHFGETTLGFTTATTNGARRLSETDSDVSALKARGYQEREQLGATATGLASGVQAGDGVQLHGFSAGEPVATGGITAAGGGYGSGAFAGQAPGGAPAQQGQPIALGKRMITTPESRYFKPADTLAAVEQDYRKSVEQLNADAPAEPEVNKRAGVDVQTRERVSENAPADNKAPSRGTGPAQVAPAEQNPPPTQQAQQARKIIRNGEMEFEVESYDSSFVQVSRIVQEEGGFVSSASSEKLPNGKVRGTVVVRVPPERLDVLVLKLRALGDLKSQKIAAQDITKLYTDLDSELKANRAMEERLLNIIKTGKGEIKDLIEAEKQLGVYRTRIEKLEGEIRYYNNLVSLSTLSITMQEKDIRQAAFASLTEQVQMGIETDDVEKTRADATKAIEDAKGRIIESNLKQHDAGQFAATIVAEVAPDAAGPLIDRLKQVGRVARLEVERKQTTPTGTAAPPGARVEKKDSRFAISIYNLANIAPRQTTTLSLAVSDVEDTYKTILDAVKARGGRIVSSALNRQKPDQTSGAISFEVPAPEADAALMEIRRGRDVLALTVSENPDTKNVTAAKRGFSLSIVSLATVPARESEQQRIATRGNVAEVHKTILEALKKADARILVSQVNQRDTSQPTAQLEFEVMRTHEQAVRQAIAAQTELISRSAQRSSDAQNTVDSKLRLSLLLVSADQIPPRETVNMRLEVAQVDQAASQVTAAVDNAGGRTVQSTQSKSESGQMSTHLVLDVPLNKADELRRQVRDLGSVQLLESARNAEAPDGQIGRARFDVVLATASVEDTLYGAARNGLSVAFRGLLWSVMFVVVGVLFIAPVVLVLWAAWKLARRSRPRPEPAAT